jgi:hypothetical protein
MTFATRLLFPLIALTLYAAPALAAEVCEITGRVSKMDTVQESPWADGAPSFFTTTIVHVSVELENRAPRGKAASETCRMTGDGAAGKRPPTAAYKLCSPTPVKPGDRIRATEGATPIDLAHGVVCLFDVAVLPAK